ncbi:unnamed protein product, partial [Hapterophycus canaliculatus]
LDQVTFLGKQSHGLPFHEVDLVVRESELVVIQHERSQRTREVASMLQGLSPPDGGKVLFQNQTWDGIDYTRHFEMRSRIGRVFEGQGWIENANMMENVTLASRHHGAKRKIVRKQLREWIDRLEIVDVSRERPAFVEPALLQIYQWIRALIHRPKLLILERPMQFVSSKMLPKLVTAVNELRAIGSGVLWMTNSGIANEDLVTPDLMIQIQRGQWRQLTGEDRDE